jgi:hypothetical protein
MPDSGTAQRAAVLRRLAQIISEIRRPHPVRVGIDGFSAAGKSTSADELAATLADRADRSTGFTVTMSENPGTEATDWFLRNEADEIHRRVLAGIDFFTSSPDQMATAPWMLNDWPLRLTVEEARELGTQISELALRYRREPGDPDPRPGTVRAYFQFQLLPDEEPETQR